MYNDQHCLIRPLAIFATIGVMLLTACTTPAQRYDQAARLSGIERKELQGTRWKHAVFTNQSAAASEPLHVYIEGDGTPWLAHEPATDPTPRVPLALTMLAKDPAAAVMIGRPCYHGIPHTTDCGRTLWTSHRYAREVVASLAQVIRQVTEQRHPSGIVLIGYSGGGVLAHLVAGELNNVVALVTVGANLDIDAWTAHHSYLPLDGSVNPANLPMLTDSILQRHFIGKNDNVVPAITRFAFFERHVTAQDITIDDFAHVCCWTDDWPAFLKAALEPATQY